MLFVILKDGGDMSKISKPKIVTMGSKPTLLLFIGMFVGVDVREIVVVPPERIIMIYGGLYEVIWLWRYSDTNMAPQHENFPTPTEFFFHMTLLEFTLVSENAIKNF